MMMMGEQLPCTLLCGGTARDPEKKGIRSDATLDNPMKQPSKGRSKEEQEGKSIDRNVFGSSSSVVCGVEREGGGPWSVPFQSCK